MFSRPHSLREGSHATMELPSVAHAVKLICKDRQDSFAVDAESYSYDAQPTEDERSDRQPSKDEEGAFLEEGFDVETFGKECLTNLTHRVNRPKPRPSSRSATRKEQSKSQVFYGDENRPFDANRDRFDPMEYVPKPMMNADGAQSPRRSDASCERIEAMKKATRFDPMEYVPKPMMNADGAQSSRRSDASCERIEAMKKATRNVLTAHAEPSPRFSDSSSVRFQRGSSAALPAALTYHGQTVALVAPPRESSMDSRSSRQKVCQPRFPSPPRTPSASGETPRFSRVPSSILRDCGNIVEKRPSYPSSPSFPKQTSFVLGRSIRLERSPPGTPSVPLTTPLFPRPPSFLFDEQRMHVDRKPSFPSSPAHPCGARTPSFTLGERVPGQMSPRVRSMPHHTVARAFSHHGPAVSGESVHSLECQPAENILIYQPPSQVTRAPSADLQPREIV